MPSFFLFISQSIYRIESGCFLRRIDSKEEAYSTGEQDGNNRRPHREDELDLNDLGHQVAKELPGSYTDDAASNAQHKCLQ